MVVTVTTDEKARNLTTNKNNMKEELIRLFNLRFIKKTEWNEIYYSQHHVFIFNVSTKHIKIKPRD